MRFAIKGSEASIAEMKSSYGGAIWCIVQNSVEVANDGGFDAYFQLESDAVTDDYSALTLPVFIHAVAHTLEEFAHGQHVIRINGWNGFLSRKNWEIAGTPDGRHLAILNELGLHHSLVADRPGFVAARVLSMIINEAYFALEDEVSTKAEIDTAMQLGTGYPLGPFAWSEKIGTKEIVQLLSVLAQSNSLYRPCDLLVQQLTKN